MSPDCVVVRIATDYNPLILPRLLFVVSIEPAMGDFLEQPLGMAMLYAVLGVSPLLSFFWYFKVLRAHTPVRSKRQHVASLRRGEVVRQAMIPDNYGVGDMVDLRNDEQRMWSPGWTVMAVGDTLTEFDGSMDDPGPEYD
jgi:hypothetical protein